MRYRRAVLRRQFLFGILVWTVALPAAGAAPAASNARVAFAVSVTGTQRTVVTAARSAFDDLGCAVRTTRYDTQTLTFGSAAPSRIVFATDRPSSARVDVAIRASGTRRTTRTFSGEAPQCDLAPQTSERECGPARITGNALVRLPAPGTIGLGGSLTRSRAAAPCAPSAGPARRFLAASDGRFSAGLLTDPTAARIVLRGDVRFTDTLATGARRVTIVRWKVVLRRLG